MNQHDFTRGNPMLRPPSAISVAEIRAKAPSVFAVEPHSSRSERYTYIPTIEVLMRLHSEGFDVVSAQQSRCRLPGKSDFTKHILRLQRTNDRVITVGDCVPQVCLTNSHDGTSAYRLVSGLWRLVCNNGLMVAEGYAESLSIMHSGDIIGRVIEGSYKVIADASKVANAVEVWKGITLAPAERELFATQALALRFDTDDKAAPVTATQVLRPRRDADTGADLWSTFNVVQENLVKGGNSYRAATNGRRMHTRPVVGIDQSTNLNRALWALAEGMKAIKLAA